MSEYTQGVCMDGAAILKDGQMMTIEDIISELRTPQSAIGLVLMMSYRRSDELAVLAYWLLTVDGFL